jgi:hypothetical protein
MTTGVWVEPIPRPLRPMALAALEAGDADGFLCRADNLASPLLVFKNRGVLKQRGIYEKAVLYAVIMPRLPSGSGGSSRLLKMPIPNGAPRAIPSLAQAPSRSTVVFLARTTSVWCEVVRGPALWSWRSGSQSVKAVAIPPCTPQPSMQTMCWHTSTRAAAKRRSSS